MGKRGHLPPPPLGNAQMGICYCYELYVRILKSSTTVLSVYLYCTVLCRLSCIQLYSIDNFVEEAGLWYEVWANRVNEVDMFSAQCRL